jgi:F-type H+/Na+-transporting ATPase subunit alpha
VLNLNINKKYYSNNVESTRSWRVLQGIVSSVSEGTIKAYGFNRSAIGVGMEVVIELSRKGGTQPFVHGVVLNLENQGRVGIIILGDHRGISCGDYVYCTGRLISSEVGFGLLGKVVNPLGVSLLSTNTSYKSERRPIEIDAPSIVEREPVRSSLMTGLKVIDGMIPIGRGQRELIIGDRQTGKTFVALATILNQYNTNINGVLKNKVYCIYVGVGQKCSTVARVRKSLEHALGYTTIVASMSSDSSGLQYIAPYSGCAMGEYYRDMGLHSLVIYDDLSKHAVAYRCISLLLRRPPGREAYPGDVFYLHSRLLERAAQLNLVCGCGSLTALPVIETQGGDVSAYIPTNVISITDGQLFFDKKLFTSGLKPAIHSGLSVSRVGSAAQNLSIKKLGHQYKSQLANYRIYEDFVKLGSDLDPAIQKIVTRGVRIVELLKQRSTMSLIEQVISMFAAINGYMDEIPVSYIKLFEYILCNVSLDLRRQWISNKYVYSNELSYIELFIRIFGLTDIESELHAWISLYVDIMKTNVVPMLDRLKVKNPRRYRKVLFQCYI